MKQTFLASLAVLAAGGLLSTSVFARRANSTAAKPLTEGTLWLTDSSGQTINACPLKRTEVKATISGPVARVTVTQQFTNPTPQTIEAVYQFPLPHDAAVDDMTMQVNDRTIKAQIKKKADARQIYEQARTRGQVAGLLEQERPNVFTQSVANITPGAQVNITISYVQLMPYDHGTYDFVFPMVVGPRYNPRQQSNPIEQNITAEGTRAGHDITVQVKLDVGTPLARLDSPTHAVDIERNGSASAQIKLKDLATIPNKDFILKYSVATQKIGDALLAHTDARGGYFSFVLEPPAAVAPDIIAPKELVFVIDTSGSMHGYPLDKVKETMKLALEGMHPEDKFNVITFSGDNEILWPKPVAATPDNVAKAWQFIASRRGSGGTEMMGAIKAALDPSDSQKHLRIVCFMTDGLVGNDLEILGEIQRHSNARIFSFGIGSSTNRFLLDNMAKLGRGEVEYVGLNDDGSAAARRFHERVQSPLLTDIKLEWVGMRVDEVYPQRIPDLFSAKPVVISGRYTGAQKGTLRLRGKLGGRDFVRDIAVNLPANQPSNEPLAPLWARAKVEHLTAQDYTGMFRQTPRPEIENAITQLGLDYRIMTQYTSLVAVEERVVNEGGQSRRVVVPVEMPEGVSYEGIYGANKEVRMMAYSPAPSSMPTTGFAGPLRRQATRVDAIATLPQQEPKTKPAERVGKRDASLVGLPAAQMVEVEITLNDISQATIDKLKALGIQPIATLHSAKKVVARVAFEKLAAIEKLTEVVTIMPRA
jgi:Ca-activated chloride channel family protein